jgi:hypothetical protein
MSFPFYRIKCDVQHCLRKFHIYVSCGDTPVVRAYTFQDGERWTPPEDWTAELGFGQDFEFSTALVIVDGVPGYYLDQSSSSSNSSDDDYEGGDYNFFQFTFTAAQIATPGDYYCQMIIRDAGDTQRYVMGSGTLHILESPIGGSHTNLTLTSVVNWDVITNEGTVPWPDSTATIQCSSCASPTTTCALVDHGKTWVWTGACDQTFLLPTPTTAAIGSTYQFLNLTTNIITIRPPSGTLIDGYPAIYTGENGINDNPAYTFIRVKQTTATTYNALEGRLKWTYLSI